MKSAVLFFAVVLAVLASGCLQGPKAGESVAEGTPVEVIMKDLAFNPATLTVSAGTTVRWTNGEPVLHTVDSALFSSGGINLNESFEFTFDNKGAYNYTCGIHPYMNGRIIVE